MQLLNEALLRVLTGWQGLQARLTDEEGQTLAEYGLIMTVIAVAVASVSVVVFRMAIIGAFTSATDFLNESWS